MRPLLRILVLAFVLLHAGGLTSALEAACADDCAETDCDDGCPPLCPSCHCARGPVALAAAPPVPVAEPPRNLAAVIGLAQREPASPEPGEILHVPIARAA